VKLPKPRAVLFDWDNTLIDSWAVIHDAMNRTLVRFGHEPWTFDETRERVRHSMRDSFPQLFGDDWQAANDVFTEMFAELHIKRLALLPGAEDMIRGLADRGLTLGVVSNKRGHFLRAEIEHLGWGELFHGVVGANDAARDKPAIDPVHLALEGSGIGTGPNLWFAGDADIDLRCAHAAGATAILIREQAPRPSEFEDCPPHAHATDCTGFRALVEAALA